MKKILAAVTLTLALAGCQSLFAPPLEDQAWLEACNLTAACAQLEAPQVVQSDTIFRLDIGLRWARGVFFPLDDERIVFINKTFEDDDQRYLTLVHEMVHYIDTYTGFIDLEGDFKTEGCVAETHAFDVMNIAAARIGREDLIRIDWYKSYPNCDGPVRR